MEHTSKRQLSRREFVGASAALLGAAVVPAPAEQKKKKPEAQKSAVAVPPPDEELEKALKELREFPVTEGTEPAFAFRAEWGWLRR